jgi:acetylornithine/succinyldiaminopimelate/putrescine aminotransferase
MDIIEDLLGVRDNICAAYHPGMRQGFALKKLAELYPNKSVKELSVHAESSGTIVNSIAVESVVAFAEQQNSDQAYKKVLAIDGTWAGGYGTTREGTGFGVDDYQVKRAGRSLWMERCLPPPTKENTKIFLDILQHKLNESGVAGIYIEPDVIGDLGLVSFNQKLLREVKQLMLNHNLPIIADCVQQLGRTGSYWGENVDTILSDYPLLVVTTAKSASNGQPFGFTIMPKVIADAASPLSQITTNQMNGPLLRSLVVAEILRNSELQSWLRVKARDIEAIAGSYQLSLDDGGLRGKFLNRGIYLDNNDQVKLAQIALLVEDGLLVGATPSSIRYQPMLLEYSETNRLLSKVIFRRIDMVKSGNISTEVQDIFTKMQEIPSGLARKNF